MRGASRSRGFVRAVATTWRGLDAEQRAAGVGAVLLAVSTVGPFSFLEAAVLVVCAALLLLLKKRADGARFHLPFGDGAVTAAAGIWCAVLILLRVLDRPLGQELLALVCAAIVTVAGLSQRARRPADDAAEASEGGAGSGDDAPTDPVGERGPAWGHAAPTAPFDEATPSGAPEAPTEPLEEPTPSRRREAPTDPLEGD